MREYECTLAGEKLTLVANFAASLEIAKKVGDPLMIARESNLEAEMMKKGFPYTPRWAFTIENVPLLLYIGLKAAKDKRSLEDVQALVFEAGFGDARLEAMEYLGLIIGPTPKEEIEDVGKSEGN